MVVDDEMSYLLVEVKNVLLPFCDKKCYVKYKRQDGNTKEET
jgi:hypothetical protein